MRLATDCEPESEAETPMDAGVQLSLRRSEAELALIGSIFADPGNLLAVAKKAGVAQWDFEQDDLRLIWLAMEVVPPAAGREAVCLIAKRALETEGLWNEEISRSEWMDSMLWSSPSLAALACSHFSNPSQVEVNARKLLRIIRAIRRVGELEKRIERIFTFSLSGRSPLSIHRRAMQ